MLECLQGTVCCHHSTTFRGKFQARLAITCPDIAHDTNSLFLQAHERLKQEKNLWGKVLTSCAQSTATWRYNVTTLIRPKSSSCVSAHHHLPNPPSEKIWISGEKTNRSFAELSYQKIPRKPPPRTKDETVDGFFLFLFLYRTCVKQMVCHHTYVHPFSFGSDEATKKTKVLKTKDPTCGEGKRGLELGSVAKKLNQSALGTFPALSWLY